MTLSTVSSTDYRRTRYRRHVTVRVIFIAVALLVWAWASSAIGDRWLPTPSQIASEFIRTISTSAMLKAQGAGSGGVPSHAWATGWRLLLALTFGLITALVAATAAFQFRVFRLALHAALLPWQIVPPLMLVPIIVVVAGVTTQAIVGAVAVYAFVSFTPYAIAGLASVQPSHLGLASLSGAGPLWTYWHVRFAGALPELAGPAMLVSGFCLGILTIIEFIAMPVGLGRVMKIAISYYAVDLLVVSLIWVLLIGAATDLLIRCSLRSALRWTRRA